MKKLLLILALCACAGKASAQFPTQDSLIKFINKWIRNSAVDAFTNLRLNTALIGMVNQADSAGIKKVEVSGTTLRIITVGKDTFSVTLPGGGGSGNTNSNIGSGFRLAVPNTNNIKTVFTGLNLLLDSSSNTNALTFKMDTAGVSSYYLRRKDSTLYTTVSRLGDTAAVLRSAAITTKYNFLGSIYNKNTWSDLSDFTEQGGTFSVSSNKIRATNGTASFNNTISYNYYTLLERWSVTGRAKIIDTSSTSGGIGFGVRSTNGFGASSVKGGVILSGTDAGKVILRLGVSDILYAKSDTGLAFVEGDTLLVGTYIDRDIVTAWAQNITKKSGVVSVTYNYSTIGTPSLQNTGRFAAFNFGGTQSFDIDSLSIYSTVVKNPDLYILSNSKGQCYNADQFNNSFAGKLSERIVAVNGSGGADRTVEMVTRIPEILAINPKKVLIVDAMANDKRTSIPDATAHANLIKIIDSCHAHGISVLISTPLFETALDLSDQRIWTYANFSVDSIIDVWSRLSKTAPSVALGIDGIHPLNLGHEIIYEDIINSGKLTFSKDANKVSAEGFPNQIGVWNNSRNLRGEDSLTWVNGKLIGNNLFQLGNSLTYSDAGMSMGKTSGFPTLAWYNGTGSPDEKSWDAFAFGNKLLLRAVNDAQTGANSWLEVSRTGTTISGINFPNGRMLVGATDDGSNKFQVNGAGLFNSNVYVGPITTTPYRLGIGTNFQNYPYIYWKNQDASTDSKLWDWYFDDGGNSVMRVINDANSGASEVFSINRSGTTVNYFKHSSKTWFTDTGRVDARLVYNTNIHGSFTRFSLIDKSYMDSVLTAYSVPLTTNYIGYGISSVLSGSAAYTYDGTTVMQQNSAAVGAVTNTASLSSTSGAGFSLMTLNTPTGAAQQLGILNFGSRAGATSFNYGAAIEAVSNNAQTAGSNHRTDLLLKTANGSQSTPNERMRIAFNGNVGIGQTNPTARLHLPAGATAASSAPLKFASGSLQTTAEAGTEEYDGTNFYLSPSTTRKRIPLINDATATAGQLPVGNGTDYTVADIFPIVSVSTSGTTTLAATAKITTIKGDATSGNLTITITPNHTGQIFNIKRMDGSVNTFTIQMTSGTIDGAATKTLITQYASTQIQWDGTNAIVL